MITVNQKEKIDNNSKVYWFVDWSVTSSEKKLSKCVICKNHPHMIRLIVDDSKKLSDFCYGYQRKDLFENKSDAQHRLQHLHKLYYETFMYKPYVSEKLLMQYLNKFIYVESTIQHKLNNFPNFNGIDFCDVAAGGVQIRGHHKQIKNYTYGYQITINYDFSNYLECIDKFVHMWSFYDTPNKVSQKLEFISDGEKWGWD